ncbi:MAG: hypothetical protein ACK559_36885, partial [bacterium]
GRRDRCRGSRLQACTDSRRWRPNKEVPGRVAAEVQRKRGALQDRERRGVPRGRREGARRGAVSR